MLEKAGFRYQDRIDPFDGGPHFACATNDIVPVQRYRRAKLAPKKLEGGWEEHLIAVERTGPKLRFRAVKAPCRLDDDMAFLPGDAWDALGLQAGERVHTVPLS